MSVISYLKFRTQLVRWGVQFVEHSRYDRCTRTSVPWYQHQARRYADCLVRPWDAHGIAIHHTGGPTSWEFVWDGRLSERIPGPLYTVEIYGDGIAHLTGWLVTNNVGACDKTVRDRVLAGNMPTSGGNVTPGTDDYYAANSEFYGIAYRGTAPNAAQRETAMRICAAICEAHGDSWNGGSVAGHKELTGRKPDPEGENMSTFRAGVNSLLKAGPEDDVALTTEDKAWISAEIKKQVLAALDVPIKRTYSNVESTVRSADGGRYAYFANSNSGKALAKVTALEALTAQLVAQENADLTAEDVKTIIENAVVKVDVTVTDETV